MHGSLFEASVAAFAAIGLPVTFCSSLCGLIRTLQRASTERIGEAINLVRRWGYYRESSSPQLSS